jgi:signal transduction histidine kinase
VKQFICTILLLFLSLLPLRGQVKRNIDNDSVRAVAFNEKAFELRQLNRDSALKYNRLAIQLATEHHLKLSTRNFTQTRGQLFDYVGQVDSAIFIYRKLLQQDTVLYPASAGWVFDRLGTMDAEGGYFNRSLTLLLKALDYQRHYQPGEEVVVLSHLALLGYYNHDHEKANAYAWQAKALLNNSHTLDQQLSVYNILGTLSLWIEDYDSAFYYYKKVYDPKKFGKNSPAHGDYYHMIGRVTETQGNKREGVTLFKKALALREKYNPQYSRMITDYALAEVYFEIVWEEQLNNYVDSALFHIKKVIQQAEARKDIRLQKNSNGLASDIYAATGNLTEYYKYKNKFMNLTDSLFNRSRDVEMVTFESKYHLKEKEVDNLRLTNENLKKESLITFQNYLFAGAGLLFLFVGSMLYIVYRNNQKTKALNQQIEASNRTKDRLFSIISHDLRGPIAAFENTPKILRNYLNKNQPEKVNEMIDHIDRSSKGLNQLLDNLLNWSLSQKEELVITIEKLAIKPIMDEIVTMFKDAATLKGITIVSTITDQYVMADRNTFSTVIRNLLSNAIKFSHPHSTITIDHRVSDNWIEFKFTDTGTGMNEGQLEKLFLIDKSKVRSGTAMEKGTGLGMVLIKEFIDINKGEINVESKPDFGTTFYIRLPLAS